MTVEVAAGQQQRIAVQVVQHIAMFQPTTELLEDDVILTVVGVKGMLVIRDPVTVLIAELFHHGAGLAGAGLTEDVGHFQGPPGGLKEGIPVHRADPLYLFQVLIGGMDGIHDLLIGCSGLYQVYDDISVLAFTLMFTGQLAPFQECIRIIDAGMALAGAVHIVIGTVRPLAVLLTVFQDIGPIFGGSSTGNLTVCTMKGII